MYQFDDRFLERVGLSEMKDEQKEAFLEYAQEQFEVRIGEAMSEKLSEAQLAEFDKITAGDAEVIQNWLARYPEYEKDFDYRKLEKTLSDEEEIKNNFVTKKWMDENCPDYSAIVENTLASFQQEIYDDRESILATE